MEGNGWIWLLPSSGRARGSPSCMCYMSCDPVTTRIVVLVSICTRENEAKSHMAEHYHSFWSAGLGGTWEFPFQTSSQVVMMLLVMALPVRSWGLSSVYCRVSWPCGTVGAPPGCQVQLFLCGAVGTWAPGTLPTTHWYPHPCSRTFSLNCHGPADMKQSGNE